MNKHVKNKQLKSSERYVTMLDLGKCSYFERNITFILENCTEKYKVYNIVFWHIYYTPNKAMWKFKGSVLNLFCLIETIKILNVLRWQYV